MRSISRDRPQSAPFADEARDDDRRLFQAFELNRFVEAVSIPACRTVGEARYAVIAAIKAAVGHGRKNALRRLLAHHGTMDPAHRIFEIGARLEHVIIRLETVP